MGLCGCSISYLTFLHTQHFGLKVQCGSHLCSLLVLSIPPSYPPPPEGLPHRTLCAKKIQSTGRPDTDHFQKGRTDLSFCTYVFFPFPLPHRHDSIEPSLQLYCTPLLCTRGISTHGWRRAWTITPCQIGVWYNLSYYQHIRRDKISQMKYNAPIICSGGIT